MIRIITYVGHYYAKLLKVFNAVELLKSVKVDYSNTA